MEAAAHTPGGYDGVPQSVGKEFVKADDEKSQAAGIVFIAASKILFIKRGAGGDHPNEWAFPGGHIESGETPKQAAIRECVEEVGHEAQAVMSVTSYDNNFTTFFSKEAEFEPKLNNESTGYVWTTIDDLPTPLHPSVEKLIESNLFKSVLTIPKNELDVARKIQSGELTSPQKFGNVWLFNIRITGTGATYRSSGKEYAYRSPEIYMNDEFLARCNGLAVIFNHPDKGTLNSKEFKNRSIGSIFVPYLKLEEKEVWGIAKIYDDEAVLEMIQNNLSTSPTVVDVGKSTIKLDDGTEVLIERDPTLLDHVAICNLGVWDKGGDPSGVISDSATISKVIQMNEDEMKAKADAEAEAKTKADADLTARFDAVNSRFDAMMTKMDAMMEAGKPKEVVADTEEEKAAKAKADAEESEKKVKADADEAVKARIDAVEKMMPKAMSDSDMDAMADCQAKADSVASAFGESAGRPQLGETPDGYRRRMAAKFKKHSAAYKDVDLTSITDGNLFSVVEAQIYSDAVQAANNPIMAEGEGLRAIKTKTDAGHTIITYKGKISSWLDNFKADAFKLTQLNTGAK